MDLMWQDNNLDLRLIPYGAIATGDETGMRPFSGVVCSEA